MNKIALLLLAFALSGCGCSVVDPGTRGVEVSMGTVTPTVYKEGLVFHIPLLTSVENISIKQQTSELKSETFSSDQQQVFMNLKVLYRVPEESVMTMFTDYQGDPFAALVAPRIHEALKAVTATYSAEEIVKNRAKIKAAALAEAKVKIGTIVFLEDVVLENISYSDELEKAIESKMVQQQEAAKATFLQDKALTEAKTAQIRATGEANAINTRGAALRNNPQVLELMTIEKWKGVTPLVVGAGTGTSILLPLPKK